jgi:hypothetical protein
MALLQLQEGYSGIGCARLRFHLHARVPVRHLLHSDERILDRRLLLHLVLRGLNDRLGVISSVTGCSQHQRNEQEEGQSIHSICGHNLDESLWPDSRFNKTFLANALPIQPDF